MLSESVFWMTFLYHERLLDHVVAVDVVEVAHPHVQGDLERRGQGDQHYQEVPVHCLFFFYVGLLFIFSDICFCLSPIF